MSSETEELAQACAFYRRRIGELEARQRSTPNVPRQWDHRHALQLAVAPNDMELGFEALVRRAQWARDGLHTTLEEMCRRNITVAGDTCHHVVAVLLDIAEDAGHDHRTINRRVRKRIGG
jgi:hypothetical protein